eukprot:2019918-Prymnesium_polylepis.1
MPAQRVWQRGAWIQVVVVASLEGASSKNTGPGASSGACTVHAAGAGGAPRRAHHTTRGSRCQ